MSLPSNNTKQHRTGISTI